jgi:nitrogen fixation protein FixH
MTSTDFNPGGLRRGLRGLHVLLAFIGFFLTVFAVNGVMIYEAVSTFGGLETADAYRKGLAYNQRIAQGKAQELRGWHNTLAYAAETERVRLDVTDHEGVAVPDLVVSGEIGRPATDRFDRHLEFRQTGPGTYEAEASGLQSGWWTIDIEAKTSASSGTEGLYETKERLWIKP